MTLAELRDSFRLNLNRRDVTPTQVDMYIRGSIQRAQRLLRVPASEQAASYTIESDFTTLPIPGDFLRLVSLSHNNETELSRADLQTTLRLSKYVGFPKHFARNRGEWIIGPKPQEGDVLTVVYQADFAELAADSDSNWLTSVAPDVIVKGALSEACRVFVDPRRDSYEADFVQAITDLNMMAADEDTTNAVISPAYDYGCDW